MNLAETLYTKLSIKNGHLKEILSGSFFTIIYQVLSILVGYVFIFIVSRNYGAEAVGIYQIAFQSITLISVFALFGFEKSIIRYTAQLITENKKNLLLYIIKKTFIVLICVAVIVAGVVLFLNSYLAEIFLKDKSLGIVYILVAISVPFSMLKNYSIEIIRGMKKIKISEFLRNLFTRIIALAGLITLLVLIGFKNYYPVIVQVVGIILTALAAFFFVYRYLLKDETSSIDKAYFKGYVKTTSTMYQSVILMQISTQIPIFVLAGFSNPAEVGIYNVANRLASLTGILFTSITTIVAPKFSELFWSDNKSDLQEVVTMTSKIMFWSCGSLSLILMILSPYLMSIFGQEFSQGYIFLIILAGSNFFNAFTGPGGWLLDMIGAVHVRKNLLLLSTSLTIVLIFTLIPYFGALGLALTILINCIVSNVIGPIYIYRQYGINMIYFPFITG